MSWYIWKTRNNLTSADHPPYPAQVKSKTIYSLLEWNISHLYTGHGSFGGPTTDKWLPPPPGWFKLNFDGSFNQFTNLAGLGSIVRDSHGNVIYSFEGKVAASHPLEAELLALQNGLKVCKELQISFLRIQGDSLVLVSSVQQATNMAWNLTASWRQTMESLMNFQGCTPFTTDELPC